MNSVDDIVVLSENDDDCILESVIYKEPKNRCDINYDEVCKENPLLATFMNACLNLENTLGMKRAIHRTLLSFYTKADKDFVKSQHFQQAVNRAIHLVNTNPDYKFSHVKDLCDILKVGKVKKRAKLITLSSNVKANNATSSSSTNDMTQRVPPNDSIESNEVSIIDLDTLPDTSLSEKENSQLTLSQSSTEEKLLVPQKVLEFDANENNKLIEKIESEIASYKEILAKLDEEEVCDDSMNSPYVKSEKIKEKIVGLYKELCKLTGAEPVKKRMINLKVIQGHPAGPVRRLERFLNKNIGDDGDPPFPNFRDVVKCVLIANEKDQLGWSKQQVMAEARALFTHCGRALQKRRQRREWKDLLSKAKVEQCDDDPADRDPELLARLEVNKKVALAKEMEVLERFTMMQNGIQKSAAKQITEMKEMEEALSDSEIDSSSDDNCEQENNTSRLAVTSENKFDSHIDIKEEPIHTEEIENSHVKVKKEVSLNIMEKLEELGDDYTTTVVEIEDFVTVEISDSSDDESV